MAFLKGPEHWPRRERLQNRRGKGAVVAGFLRADDAPEEIHRCLLPGCLDGWLVGESGGVGWVADGG